MSTVLALTLLVSDKNLTYPACLPRKSSPGTEIKVRGHLVEGGVLIRKIL